MFVLIMDAISANAFVQNGKWQKRTPADVILLAVNFVVCDRRTERVFPLKKEALSWFLSSKPSSPAPETYGFAFCNLWYVQAYR